MKFLSLHGAIGNPGVLSIQLGPLIQELTATSDISFSYACGRVPATTPPDFADFFGPGPHYRFLDDEGMAEDAMLNKIRDFPEAMTPEDSMRGLIPEGVTREGAKRNIRAALDALYQQMHADEEIQGVVGYSEGAAMAASLLLDDGKREKPQLKCGIFFAGWPPVTEDGKIVLADESDDVIEVPTLHVVGSMDPYLAGSMSLYNTCHEDSAQLFDHGKGHAMPRDHRTIVELAAKVREMVSSVA